MTFSTYFSPGVALQGGGGSGGGAASLPISGNGATITASTPLVDGTQTWNNSGVTFTALKLNVTDTASNASSLLMDLQRNGSSRFAFDKRGNILVNGDSSTGYALGFKKPTDSAYPLIFGMNADDLPYIRFNNGSGGGELFLTRKGAANLRLGAADAATPVAQTLSVQSVVAGTSNTAGANLTITGSQGTGTGAGGSIIFQVAPAGSSGTAQNAFATALTIDSALDVSLAGRLNFPGSNNRIYRDGSALSSMYFVVNNSTALTLGMSTSDVALNNSYSLSWGVPGATDVRLFRDAADTLALRNSTNAQTFRIYNTFTDATTFERGFIQWASSVLEIGTEKGSVGGTARGLKFKTDGIDRWQITSTTGHLIASVDNTYDIGASGATRPRNVYVATNGYFGTPTTPSWWTSSRVLQVGHAALFNSAASVTSALSLSSNLHETGSGSVYIATGFAAKYDQNTGAHVWYTAPSGSAGAALTFTEYMRLTNAGLLTFAGTTSSFPALKRSSTTLQVRLADDTANAPLESASVKTDAPAGGTSGTWKLGVAATVSPTSPNRTIEVDIGGTIYYIAAKTTND